MCLVTLAIVAVVPAWGDVVWTAAERLEGPVAFTDGGVSVSGKTVPAEELLMACLARPACVVGAANVVRTADGDIWRGEVMAVSTGTLSFRSPLLGAHQVPLSAVRAIEFEARLPAEAGSDIRTLYRRTSEPLPGKILWVTAAKIAIESPFGAIAVDRDSAQRYVLDRPRRPAFQPGTAEVELTDGSVLHGTLTLARETLTLKHAQLGQVVLPVRVVRSVLRMSPRVAWVTDLPLEGKATSLLGLGDPIQVLRSYPAGEGSTERPFVRALAIEAPASVTMTLPGGAGAKGVLRATVAPMAGARCGARLRVLGDGKVLLDKPAPAAAEAISVDLRGAASLSIEVSLNDRALFPCGVVLHDPHIVRE